MTFFRIETTVILSSFWDLYQKWQLYTFYLFWFFRQKREQKEKKKGNVTKILFCYRLFQTQHFLLRCQKDSFKQSPSRLKSYNKVKIIFMIVFHTFFFCEMTFLAHPNLVACIYLMNRKDRRKILLSTGNRIEMHWKNNQNLE